MSHSLEFMAGWLCGFFDGEGSARFKETVNGKKHTCYYLSVSNTDSILMQRCSDFLDALGIGHTKWSYRPKRTNRKDFATLHICRAEDILSFHSKVGFQAPHKIATLEQIVFWINRSPKHSDLLPAIAERHRKGESIRSIVKSLGLAEGAHFAMSKRLQKAGYTVSTVKKGRPKTVSI